MKFLYCICKEHQYTETGQGLEQEKIVPASFSLPPSLSAALLPAATHPPHAQWYSPPLYCSTCMDMPFGRLLGREGVALGLRVGVGVEEDWKRHMGGWLEGGGGMEGGRREAGTDRSGGGVGEWQMCWLRQQRCLMTCFLYKDGEVLQRYSDTVQSWTSVSIYVHCLSFTTFFLSCVLYLATTAILCLCF